MPHCETLACKGVSHKGTMPQLPLRLAVSVAGWREEPLRLTTHWWAAETQDGDNPH